ncbi:hypothetical protein ACM01_16500 [Streptomyces viridochromogenes]|uniref:Uncharacterized protein n=1 Tax=Streptomyces viridochromogenes TaxID=1938 RepID=A0A0J7ZFF9_STRVR|nr:hypothetical protein ACM01_16500 [Streptomyces viridochromogenes]
MDQTTQGDRRAFARLHGPVQVDVPSQGGETARHTDPHLTRGVPGRRRRLLSAPRCGRRQRMHLAQVARVATEGAELRDGNEVGATGRAVNSIAPVGLLRRSRWCNQSVSSRWG